MINQNTLDHLPQIVTKHYQQMTNETQCLIAPELCSDGELRTLAFLIESEPHPEWGELPDQYQWRKDLWARALAEVLCTIERKQVIAV